MLDIANARPNAFNYSTLGVNNTRTNLFELTDLTPCYGAFCPWRVSGPSELSKSCGTVRLTPPWMPATTAPLGLPSRLQKKSRAKHDQFADSFHSFSTLKVTKFKVQRGAYEVRNELS